MNEWAELDHALEAMLASGPTEVREDGEWLAELAQMRCELRLQGKSALVHLWSDERNLTRRVLRVREQSQDHIILDVQRFGRSRRGRLEFLRTESQRPAARISREQFRARFRRLLAERFPDATIDSLTTSADLEHSFSGTYVRGVMHEATHSWALLAVAPDENPGVIERALAFGILWLDWVRARNDCRVTKGLRLFVPEKTPKFLLGPIFSLSPDTQIEAFETSKGDGSFRRVDLADCGNLQSWLVPRKEVVSACGGATEAMKRIHALAVHLPPAGNEISTRLIPRTAEVALCFRGLEFARWSREGISFGLSDSREKLTSKNEAALDRLMQRLDTHRNSFAQHTNHPLYRASPERWLETVVMQDPAALDAKLDPAYLYAQVPALTAGDRGVIDLLGVTRAGRLVVIELKASEDIQLPIQAIDYWLRVRRHQRDADFERYGYFTGIELDSRSPLLWLVAPALQFHQSLDVIAKYISKEAEITRIGVNENWRLGLKVMLRQ